MAWRVWSVSTSDWQTKVKVTPTSAPWARAMGSGRQEQMVFDVLDPKVAAKVNETTMAPWKRLLVMENFGQIIYAGFITDADYDRDAGTVTVYHEDAFSLWRKRIMAGTVADGMQAGPALTFTNVTLPTLVKQAFYNGQNDAARFNVPIVLPADESGTQSKKFDPWELPTVASVVEELMSTEGGPDIDLFPRWRDDGSIEWFLRMGNLTEGVWSWDISAPLSRVSGFKLRKSGDNMANRIAAVGEGSEKKMLLSVQDGSATSDFLPLDAVKSYKGEKDPAALAARARADLAACSKPTEQVSMDVEMTDNFTADMLRLGGTVNWRVQDDPFVGTGSRSARLIEFSGDLTNKIHLEFQTA
jgi:hypothetical protein